MIQLKIAEKRWINLKKIVEKMGQLKNRRKGMGRFEKS